MLLPRMKYGLPLSIARPVAGSSLNSRMPNRVWKRSAPLSASSVYRNGILGRPEPATGDGDADVHRLSPCPPARLTGSVVQPPGDFAGLRLAHHERHGHSGRPAVVAQHGLHADRSWPRVRARSEPVKKCGVPERINSTESKMPGMYRCFSKSKPLGYFGPTASRSAPTRIESSFSPVFSAGLASNQPGVKLGR